MSRTTEDTDGSSRRSLPQIAHHGRDASGLSPYSDVTIRAYEIECGLMDSVAAMRREVAVQKPFSFRRLISGPYT